MISMKQLLTLLGAFQILLPAARAVELPTLSDSPEPFSFAVLGDLHFSRPDFVASRVGAGIAEAVKDAHPSVAFVCQTGDLIHGELPSHKQLDREGVKEELDVAIKSLTGQFNVPLFLAVGNHDKNAGGKPYPEVFLPVLSHELGTQVTRLYYAFRYGNACFIFLDYGDYSETGTSMDYAAQRTFLEETLAQAHATNGIKHVFAFGHYPLWPVVRPGFSSRRFTDSVVSVLKHAPVDAYFCGHTHNSGAWVRRVDGVPVTQIMGVAMDQSVSLQSMEDMRTQLIPRAELSYGWGYLSGPSNSFYLVSVDGPRVRVQFRSGREVLREFVWQEPGQISDIVKPSPHPSARVTEADLGRAVAATLVFTPWAEERADVTILLNNEKLSLTRIEPMPRWAAFGSEVRVTLPKDKLKCLLLDNDVIVENPDKKVFGIGNVRLDVRLDNGTTARTSVSERYFFSASKAEADALHRATYGWEIIPAAVTATANLGHPLGPVRLHFSDNAK